MRASSTRRKARCNRSSREPKCAGGAVRLELPTVADDGHSVPIVVRVDSPMSGTDYVRRIDLVSEKNPVPLIATFFLGPETGRAEIESRLRLNGTQR